jgi:coenzyme F420-reducing hydrogenase gamma subunit
MQNNQIMISYGDQAKIKAREACSACYGSLLHALKRIDKTGQLDKIAGTIKIGQGYQGEDFAGVGIGSCCSGTDKNVKGCPPSAKEILNFLAENYNIRF